MNRFFKFLTICLAASTIVVSCTKKPLTLDDSTSMKTLLKANDKEIKELIVKEAKEKANISEENIDVEYILRDEKTQVIATKIKVDTK